jgi:phosphoglycerate kinase
MHLKTPATPDVSGKTVLVRVDYNVPLEEKRGAQVVTDDRRIQASLQTLQFLQENGAKIVLISHLGRPVSQPDDQFSLEPVARHLGEVLNFPVTFVPEVVGQVVKDAVNAHQPGQALLLQNLRFHPGEKNNDPEFAKELASLADIYINDAFSAAHRAHASTVGVAEYLPAFAGFSLQEEVQHLAGLMEDPQRPLIIVLGGAKISDKVGAAEHLSKIADLVLIGGAVANNFIKADGIEVHKSYLEDSPADSGKEGVDYVEFARRLLDAHKTEKVLKDGYIPLPKILYPVDVLAAPNKDTADATTVTTIDISAGLPDTDNDQNLAYLDIGPNTIKLYSELLAKAGTIFWNGPMGVWENELFAQGTQHIAQAIADNPNTTVVGGGDTIAAIEHFGLTESFKYVSIAGGAALDFLSGKMLPGIAPLVVEQ